MQGEASVFGFREGALEKEGIMGLCVLPAGGGIVGVDHLCGCRSRVCFSAYPIEAGGEAATLDAGGVGACPHISLWFFLFASLARVCV